ncbi:MAG TPA: DUF4097 family beta strand repeat-containing protein [Jiangellaceae bacterium]|nr:DUF4097 family beta strand repeat-containing protein [Jiangellaceae bacterium]
MTIDSPRRRRPILRILLVVAIVLLALGLWAAASWALRSTESDTVSIDESYDSIAIDVSAGDIVIEAGSGDDTTLEWRTEVGPFRDAEVSHRVDGDRLVIDTGCEGGLLSLPLSFCRADLSLTVPADVDVVAESSAGQVRASGLEGSADLESSAGEVRVDDHSGRLRAHSSAGAVIVDGLASDDAEVSSSAGRVEVTATEPPQNLRAESSAGQVIVTLPDETYDLDADSSAGDVTIEVPTDPDSRFHVEASSSAGDVTVTSG